ncbi:MAG: tRNA (adenosine(37)-N6)-threonylcarbamoyltransferase complex dimerization subunit type 1 TsaB [Oscillospiraceae bacterium]
MQVFGIDTCCMAATAAVVDENRLIAESVINHKRTHSQKMMPQIAAMLEMAEVDISDVDAFAVAVGPGSFTGVRIGVATAKAFAQATKKPCVPVSTLHALAYNVKIFGGFICPILDARREQVYNAIFEGGTQLKRKCDDRAIGIKELLSELDVLNTPCIFVGDATLVYRDIICEKLGERAVFATPMQNMNLGGAVAEIGMECFKNGETTHYSALIPQYVRLSQAEQEKALRG